MDMPSGRACEICLADDVARRVFDNNLLMVGDIQAMAKYDKVCFRARQCWHDIFANRALLSELLQASNGQVPQQVCLCRQLDAWRVHIATIKGNYQDVERLAYRLRVMCSHLIQARRGGRNPPLRYDCLKALLSMVCIKVAKHVPEDEPPCALQDEAQEILPGPASDRLDDEIMISSDDESSIASLEIVDEHIAVSDLERDLFTPAKSSPLASTKATPEKVALVASTKATAEKSSLAPLDAPLSDDCIDALLDGETKAPDTREYAAVRRKPASHKAESKVRVRKKPSARVPPCIVPASSGKLTGLARKNMYSKVYHSTLKKGVAAGLSVAVGKRRAQAAAKFAVDGS